MLILGSAIQGFQTISREGIVVSVGNTTPVDLTMKVGTMSETLTVKGESPTIDTTSANVNVQSGITTENTEDGKKLGISVAVGVGSFDNTVQALVDPGAQIDARGEVAVSSDLEYPFLVDNLPFSQFDANDIEDYELIGLSVRGGRVGRAGGRYVVSMSGADSIRGRVVLGVERDDGRARVALIATTPRS